MGVNSLPKTVIGQHRGRYLNPGPTAPESSTPTTRLPRHPTSDTEASRPASVYSMWYDVSGVQAVVGMGDPHGGRYGVIVKFVLDFQPCLPTDFFLQFEYCFQNQNSTQKAFNAD